MDTGSLPEQLIAKAELELKKWRWFNPDKYENASFLLKRAAIKYKIKKMYNEAANTYIRASKCYFDNDFEKTNLIIDACRCYLKFDLMKAEEYFVQSAEFYENNNMLQRAGSLYEELADNLQKNSYNLEVVIKYYRKSIDMYQAVSLMSSVIKIQSKVAYLLADKEEYDQAIDTFDEIIDTFMNNNDYSKKYYSKLFCDSVLCCLCLDDVVRAQRLVAKYLIILPSLTNEYRWKMTTDIIESVSVNNIKMFDEAVNSYNKLNMFDDWTVKILTFIKSKLTKTDDLC